MPRRSSARTFSDAAAKSCPCGLGAPYAECCGAFHEGRAAAPTAERLMRSRYSAFAISDTAYLLRTWYSGTRPAKLTVDPGLEWTGLDVLGTTGGSAFHTEGTVEFTAHYRVGGVDEEQHENSRFVREDGLWVYVDAIL
ncbi:MAG TPA: YchJ family metal-binding protein [Kribbella sp.]